MGTGTGNTGGGQEDIVLIGMFVGSKLLILRGNYSFILGCRLSTHCLMAQVSMRAEEVPTLDLDGDRD